MKKCKRRGKWFFGIGLGVVAVLSVGMVMAAGGPPHFGCHKNPERLRAMVQWKVDDILDEIDADEAQREEIRLSVSGLVTEAIALHGNDDGHRELVRQELAKDVPDEAKLRAVIDQKLDKANDFSQKVLDTVLDIHGELTPAQRVQLMELVDEHHRR